MTRINEDQQRLVTEEDYPNHQEGDRSVQPTT